MDLLKTLLVYMSLVFTTSVQTAPEPSYIPLETPAPTAYVQSATATPKPTPVPTINITPNPAYKTIQVGDNGDLVRQMQEKLAEYGYYDGEIDGRFGNQTRRAVEAFQYRHGLSADGIAGRHTLTVLYESPEIRLAPQAEATATVTPQAQLAVAITPEPTAEATAEPKPTETPEPTFAPVETVVPAAAPTETPVAKTAAELLARDGWTIRVSGTDETVVASDAATPLKPYDLGDVMYLPLKELLTAGYLNVISSSSIEKEELAFAIGSSIVSISYTEDQSGAPVSIEAFVNGQPQVLPVRDIRMADKTIYLPAASIESLTGITFTTDEAVKTIVVTMPTAE
ncbi:MAG: peptidoglycan-binding protein [Clostridia bacterium]|nr:peptidoglycan-binding protein [Clostridia bacterium]